MDNHLGTINPPTKPSHIPENSQWLLGQGAGVWFSIEKLNENGSYRVLRFSPQGNLDCDRVFRVEENGSTFDLSKEYEFIHISHCAKCRIKQNGIVFVLNYVEN